MITIDNLVLNLNLENPVIFFDLNSVTYSLLLDGSDKVLNGAMDEVVEDLTEQLITDQDWEGETTLYRFDEFILLDNNGEITAELT